MKRTHDSRQTLSGAASVPEPADQLPRDSRQGSNISRVRAHNERLVLSLIRDQALSRAEIARRTGLSAQTVSVITRALSDESLIRAGDPVRGRVGQPSIPLTLNPAGAFFLGVKIGRRSAELALMNFTGEIVARRESRYRYPLPDPVVDFLRTSIPQIIASLPATQRRRVYGVGVATPFELWTWSDTLNAPAEQMNQWRDFPLQARLEAIADLPVFIDNDATAACGAELTFGRGTELSDFAYFFIGFFIGGGIVMNQSVYRGHAGNAGAFGSLPVLAGSATSRGVVQLIDMASIYVLQKAAAGNEPFGDDPFVDAVAQDWAVESDLLDNWISVTAHSLAMASTSITGTLDCQSVVIDGVFPPHIRDQIVERTQARLQQFNTRGITMPRIEAGQVGADARVLGAARLPMFNRFLLDQSVLTHAIEA